MQLSNFEPHYERTPGMYTFTARDGTPVHAIALPTWEEVEQALAEVPPTDGYIVTPELATSPRPLEEISNRLEEIGERVATAQALSTRYPEATVLLGTASLDDSGAMHNSLAVITDGCVVGHIDKRGVMWPAEGKIFSRQEREQASLRIGHAALICSDIISAGADARIGSPERAARLLANNVETLLVSSCWAVPRYPGLLAANDEARYRGALERAIEYLFAGYPSLQEVIVVDRAISGSGVSPYTGQFQRIEKGTSE